MAHQAALKSNTGSIHQKASSELPHQNLMFLKTWYNIDASLSILWADDGKEHDNMHVWNIY